MVFVQTREVFLKEGYHRCRIGMNHVAFYGGGKADVDHLALLLRERGALLLYENRYPYAGGNDHYALYFEDPDRIKVEVVAQDP